MNKIAEDQKLIRLSIKYELMKADNAKLREALDTLLAQFDERGYPSGTHANVNAALLDARRVLEETSHEQK